MDPLERKVRQMNAAVGNTVDPDISKVVAQTGLTAEGLQFFKVDANAGVDPIELDNKASQLIANIACLKDHLKAWCQRNNIPFGGEALIDSNRSVALIHDLWNTDKHAVLSRPPRSGIRPELKDLQRVISMSSGTQPGSMSFLSWDRTGAMRSSSTEGGGSTTLRLHARIVDSANGETVADFMVTCQEAVSAWETEMKNSGVVLPIFSS